MLSSLPKLADRAFLLSAFFPTLIFAVVILIMFRDMPTASGLFGTLVAKEIEYGAYFLLCVAAGAASLIMINSQIYAWFQGYLLPRWIATPLTRRYQRKRDVTYSELERLDQVRQTDGSQSGPHDEYARLRIYRMQHLPSDEGNVLPTRFGNAIKAFEVYPRDVYGADGSTMWPRLTAVLPAHVMSQVQDIRSQIDLLLNCSFLSLILVFLALGRLALSPDWTRFDLLTPSGICAAITNVDAIWLVWAISGLGAAYLFYRWAALLVPSWGAVVMSAFDCYLPALATQLGFKLPAEKKQRKHFWTTLSQQISYGPNLNHDSPFDADAWPRADSDASTHETTPTANSPPPDTGDTLPKE